MAVKPDVILANLLCVVSDTILDCHWFIIWFVLLTTNNI